MKGLSTHFRRAMNHALSLMAAAVIMAFFWCFFRLPDANLLMVTFAFLATSVLYDVDGWKDRLKLSLIMALYASMLQFLVGICHQAKFLQVILPALFSFFTLRSLDNRCAACAVIIVGYLGFFAPGGFMPAIDRAIGIFVGVIAIMLATALVGLVHLRHAYISTFGKPFTLIEAWRITLMLGFGTFISNVLKLSQGPWIMLTIVFIYLAVNETQDHVYFSKRRIFSVPLGLFLGAMYMSCLVYFNYQFIYLIPLLGALGFFILYYYDDYFFFTVMFMVAFSIYADWATGDMHQFHIREMILSRSLATTIGIVLVLLFQTYFLPETGQRKADSA